MRALVGWRKKALQISLQACPWRAAATLLRTPYNGSNNFTVSSVSALLSTDVMPKRKRRKEKAFQPTHTHTTSNYMMHNGLPIVSSGQRRSLFPCLSVGFSFLSFFSLSFFFFLLYEYEAVHSKFIPSSFFVALSLSLCVSLSLVFSRFSLYRSILHFSPRQVSCTSLSPAVCPPKAVISFPGQPRSRMEKSPRYLRRTIALFNFEQPATHPIRTFTAWMRNP